MARRRKSTSRKKGSSHFWSKLLLFLLLLILGVGFGVWKYPTTARQWVAVIVEKVRPARQNPPKEPQPEPIVTQTSPIPQEPVVTVPGSTTAQQQSVIAVQTQYDHLKLGVPGKADTIIDRPGYALGYIEYHEQPAWVISRLTKEQALTKAAKRGDDFKEDPEVPTGSATLADYRRSGYDRGHLAPAADMAYSLRTMGDSFFMSNMSPQWSGYWNNRLDTFVGKINADEIRQLDSAKKGYALIELLKDAINNMSEIACQRIDEVRADNRSKVVRYHLFLWVWHHLNQERLNVWKSFMDGVTHVDHSLAFAFWLRLIGKEADKMTKPEYDEAERFINSLGNCILLKSEYNCSKSDQPFRCFFSWFPPENEPKLLLQPCMTAPQSVQGDNVIQIIKTAMRTREQKIREELKLFATGVEGYSLHN